MSSGMPLLSGPPPEHDVNEQSCRKCDKESNLLFARLRKCNHCGYSYCHSCSDFHALMPRPGPSSGHDVVPVCAYCIDNLNITASSKDQLRRLPLSKLKNYASAYGIKINNAVEKDDITNALIAARQPHGCLAPQYEDYYRKNGVPNRSSSRPRGFFTRAMDAMNPERGPSSQTPQAPQQQQQRQRQRQSSYSYETHQRTSGSSSFPRPDLDARQQQASAQGASQPRSPPQPQYPPSGQHLPHHHYPPYAQYQSSPGSRAQPQHPPRPPTFRRSQPDLDMPNTNASQPRGRASSASASTSATPRGAQSPPPPVPTLDELLDMPEGRVAALSIGTLKQVLFQNHVIARLVVEKEELVAKVRTLIEDERAERARHAMAEEQESGGRSQHPDANSQTGLYGDSEDEDEVLARVLEESRRTEEERVEAQRIAEERGRLDEEMHVDDQDHAAAESHEIGGEPARPSSTPASPEDDHVGPATPIQPATTPSPKRSSSTTPGERMSASVQAAASRLERTGLCVICQDEEANIAIVDCGHLAMCRACSDLVMKSSRECPLCRTRIVTESRLLRIFKA